ncbi:hypothetical protein DY000_02047496 [Brassica cretica]|uniref:Uncharacterized protein n=1 Tax=Brassica cretica TaxID=69181 RepID=A0ABQ7ERF7_BRACR|nr:hypothetical protein DY000_02047496 [Brassica cretica]
MDHHLAYLLPNGWEANGYSLKLIQMMKLTLAFQEVEESEMADSYAHGDYF